MGGLKNLSRKKMGRLKNLSHKKMGGIRNLSYKQLKTGETKRKRVGGRKKGENNNLILFISL